MKSTFSKSGIKTDLLDSDTNMIRSAYVKPGSVIKKDGEVEKDPRELLKDSVIEFNAPTDSVADDEWTQA